MEVYMKTTKSFRLMLFTIILIVTLTYLVFGSPETAHSVIGQVFTPTAYLELVLRKKICYKIFADSTGFKITDQTLESLFLEGVPYWEVRVKLQTIQDKLYADEKTFTDALTQTIGSDQTTTFKDLIKQYADARTRVVDGPIYDWFNGNPLTGHYTFFGNYTPGKHCNEIYDYWEEESYQVFKFFSETKITNLNYSVDISYGKYFGETPNVDVDIVQLPQDFRSLIWDRGSMQIHLAIEEIKSGKVLTTLPIGIDQGVLHEDGVKLSNLISFEDLTVMETETNVGYDYGYYALRVKNKINPHVCGGVKGYTLTEDPVKLEVSLTDSDGNPLTNFKADNGVVLDLCVNGFTTPGYGFVVQNINLVVPDEGPQPPEVNKVFLLDSEFKKTGYLNQIIEFHACAELPPATPTLTDYLEQRIPEVGGKTLATFWVAETHKNPTYFVDYGNGQKEQITKCVWTHTYSATGEYNLDVEVQYDEYFFSIPEGKLIFSGTRTIPQELARKLIVISKLPLAKLLASPAVDFYNVNNLILGFVPGPRSSYTTTTETSGCPPTGFVGKFSFTATLAAQNGSPPLSNIVVRVSTLSNGNLLQNAAGGPAGVGALLRIPTDLDRDYQDGIFTYPENIRDIPFTICLTRRTPFTFFVDVLGTTGP
jgi:hypothetical protein